MLVEIRLQYRVHTRTKSYNKRDYIRLVQPVMDRYNAKLIQTITSLAGYTYSVVQEPITMLLFRRELTAQMRRLHPKATFGWSIVQK